MAAVQSQKFCCSGGGQEEAEISVPLTASRKMLPQRMDSRCWDDEPQECTCARHRNGDTQA